MGNPTLCSVESHTFYVHPAEMKWTAEMKFRGNLDNALFVAPPYIWLRSIKTSSRAGAHQTSTWHCSQIAMLSEYFEILAHIIEYYTCL